MDTSAPTQIELVITLPELYGPRLAYRTGCRTTLGALVELVARARRRIVVAAPFLQPGYGISSGVLADALISAVRRDVQAAIVSTGRGLESVDLARIQNSGRAPTLLFRPSANVQDDRQLGSHAKFCLSDDDGAYVGSANLTGPGLSGQLEMGVLVRGSVARQISAFWDYCVDAGIFVRVDVPLG